MSNKIYTNNAEFKRKLENAVKLISENVLATYGPFGKNILINNAGHTFLTKDGVTVAKSIFSQDPTENAILDIIKQTADKTVKDAGDGTSSSILFIREFIKIISETLTAFSDKSSTEIKNEFEKQLKEICNEFNKYSIDVSSKETLIQVAYMASNGDKLVSNLVADLIDSVGTAGSISIKTSKSNDTHIKIMEGMKFSSAVASNSFLNDLQDKKVLNDCVIVPSICKIAYNDDFTNLLRNVVEHNKSVLFICPDIDERCVLTLIANIERGNLQCAVLYPAFLGNEKLEVIEDIALLCGTISNSTSNLNRTIIKEWGYAKSVEVTKTTTTIMDGNASAELIDRTLDSLKTRLQAEEDGLTIKRLEARISRLTSTLGVLYIGGATEAEVIEKKHRAEDALESCHSAMRLGIVPGGGMTAYHIAMTRGFSADDMLAQYVTKALNRLLRSQAEYLYEFRVPYSNGLESITDLRTGQVVRPFEAGVIEAVHTIQAALYNAFSASWVLCSSWGAIIDG